MIINTRCGGCVSSDVRYEEPQEPLRVIICYRKWCDEGFASDPFRTAILEFFSAHNFYLPPWLPRARAGRCHTGRKLGKCTSPLPLRQLLKQGSALKGLSHVETFLPTNLPPMRRLEGVCLFACVAGFLSTLV